MTKAKTSPKKYFCGSTEVHSSKLDLCEASISHVFTRFSTILSREPERGRRSTKKEAPFAKITSSEKGRRSNRFQRAREPTPRHATPARKKALRGRPIRKRNEFSWREKSTKKGGGQPERGKKSVERITGERKEENGESVHIRLLSREVARRPP